MDQSSLSNISEVIAIKEQYTCQICKEEYDERLRMPMRICTNQHEICNKCLHSLYNVNEAVINPEVLCPVCRQIIQKANVKFQRHLLNAKHNGHRIIQRLRAQSREKKNLLKQNEELRQSLRKRDNKLREQSLSREEESEDRYALSKITSYCRLPLSRNSIQRKRKFSQGKKVCQLPPICQNKANRLQNPQNRLKKKTIGDRFYKKSQVGQKSMHQVQN